MIEERLNEAEVKMQASLKHLEIEMGKVSTGRANANVFNEIMVEYYGEPTPLPQTSSVKIQDASTIVIVPFDKNTVKDVIAGITKSSLQLNPQDEGDKIRINIPALTTERRDELSKRVKDQEEHAKVAVRQVRQEYIKKARNDEDISEDLEKQIEKRIQELTDKYISKVEEMVKTKIDALHTI